VSLTPAAWVCAWLQPDGKQRVLCVTAKRRSKKRGFKGTLHVAKLSQGKYQVGDIWRQGLIYEMDPYEGSWGQGRGLAGFGAVYPALTPIKEPDQP
jgi:hypothetical protein